MPPAQFDAKFVGRYDEDGVLHLAEKDRFKRLGKAWAGQSVHVRVLQPAKPRSIPQNNYYRGVVLDILADHLVYDVDELHELLKARFLGVENPDSPLPRARSTATLTTDAFERYLEQIRVFAAVEFGCVIPDPDGRMQGAAA